MQISIFEIILDHWIQLDAVLGIFDYQKSFDHVELILYLAKYSSDGCVSAQLTSTRPYSWVTGRNANKITN